MPLRHAKAAVLSEDRSPESTVRPCVICYSVQADAGPGVMPRVLELFAKRNLVPERWHSDVVQSRSPSQGGVLSIDIQVAGLTVQTGEYIARCLRRIWGVEAVLMSQKGM